LLVDLSSQDAELESGTSSVAALEAKNQELRLWVGRFLKEQNDES
jgi:hypothetical protein